MMNIDAVEAAILKKDPDGVVAALSEWDEPQREAAREPFNIFMLALGLDDHVAEPCDLKPDDPAVVAKRQRDGLAAMSRKDRTYDYEMSYIARLALYGIAGLDHCVRRACVVDYRRQAAQIMADRRPPWWDQWYRAVTSGERLIEPEYWALLYERGMIPAGTFGQVAEMFLYGLPGAMASSPQATQKVMQDIEACRELVYTAARNERILYNASDWVPVIDWLRNEKLLDASRLLGAVLDALHQPFNQAERNGAVIFAKAAKASGKVLAEHQARWAGLVADIQASVAGFAVGQLAKVQEAGLLDVQEAIAALPHIFVHKPRTHAKKAVEMLAKIAEEPSHRSQAVEAITTALMHPDKDVQKAALDALDAHLQPSDGAAVESLRLHLSSVAATLQAGAEKLLARVDGGSPAEDGASVGSAAHDLAHWQQAVANVPTGIRSRLRLNEALEAAADAKIDLAAPWTTEDVRILASVAPIGPIETVEELVDVTTAAVENCECPDTAERIVSGIVRLYRERPQSFDAMTQSLRKRGCARMRDRPQRGIVGGHIGRGFVLLIGAWLGVDPDEDAFDYLTDPVQRYLAELSKRVRAGIATPLVSEATHAGGWIDPRVWVTRLIQAQADAVELFDDDLVRSLLRLTPDGRDEALAMCEPLKFPLKPMAVAALGGEVKIDNSSTPQVWITALRARDPWIDLSNHLSPEERATLPDEFKSLPDVVYPADYQWRVCERIANTAYRDLIQSWPTQEDRSEVPSQFDVIAQLLEGFQGDDDAFSKAMAQAAGAEARSKGVDFLTAALHHLPCNPGPPFFYPYLALQWPRKLDWYWCLATKGLSKRVESGSSVDEPYGRFLLPLLAQDQPVTQMAGRALWIATVSKDGNSRSAAVEAWIALIETDRTDLATLATALEEVLAGGWVKLNRIAEALAEVAAVSPLHAWVVAELLDAYLGSLEAYPRGIAPLLELLDECNQRLGRVVSDRLNAGLPQIKSGKAKSTAKSLLNRVNEVTADREAAVAAAVEARLARSCRLRNVGSRQC